MAGTCRPAIRGVQPVCTFPGRSHTRFRAAVVPSAFRAPRGRVCDMGCPEESFRFAIEFSTPRAPCAAHVSAGFDSTPHLLRFRGSAPALGACVLAGSNLPEQGRNCQPCWRDSLVSPGKTACCHVGRSGGACRYRGRPRPGRTAHRPQGAYARPEGRWGSAGALWRPPPPRCRMWVRVNRHRRLWGYRRARTRSHTVELSGAHTVPSRRPLGPGPRWGSVCRVCAPPCRACVPRSAMTQHSQPGARTVNPRRSDGVFRTVEHS